MSSLNVARNLTVCEKKFFDSAKSLAANYNIAVLAVINTSEGQSGIFNFLIKSSSFKKS